MAQIHELVASGLKHAEGVAGTSFKVDRVATTFRGIYSGLTYAERLVAGGGEQNIDSRIVCNKDQFTGNWQPVNRTRLFIDRKPYEIVAVSEDEAQFTFELRGIN